MPHADPAAVRFVDDRQAGALLVREPVGQRTQMDVIDEEDDLRVTRQHLAHQRERPHLERFRQQRMVRVVERCARNTPRLAPADLVLVEQ